MENKNALKTAISLNLRKINDDDPKTNGGGDTGGTGNDGGNTGGNG